MRGRLDERNGCKAMTAHDSSRDQARVLIAGGGFAAVEAALALRALAGDRIELGLISPDPTFRYRPAATLEPFEKRIALRYDLRAIAEDLRADYHNSRLESVASRARRVQTASGARLEYDALILAVGARPVTAISGALTFRDERDLHLIRPAFQELEEGRLRAVAFAAPPGCSWPLPLYELALQCAARVHELGLKSEVLLVTPEPEPLAPFGPQASRLVRGLLDDSGVRFVGGVVPTTVRRNGVLVLEGGAAISADRVVSVPELRGRRITGVPARWRGFVPVDAFGRVEGLADVYAAGDMTTFPVKHGGLAAQQADRIAQAIAAGLGADVKQDRGARLLQTRLVGGSRPVFLRTELDWNGGVTSAVLEQPDRRPSARVTKVFGRYLVPYLETLEPLGASRFAPP
jgi:sulfide:quinone oxidoreductase